MKVLLANPPWRRGKLYGIRAGSRWPFMLEPGPGRKTPGYMPFPFFMAYAAALLEKNRIETGMIDALADGLSDEEFAEKVKAFSPGLFLIETSTPSIYVDLAWAKKIKDLLPYCLIALAGTHAAVFSREILAENKFVDFVLSGEYEFELLELARATDQKNDLSGLRGITYRKGPEIIKNPPRPLNEKLDDFPWPARHMLDMAAYNDSFSGLPSPNVQVWASRGCPFSCVFCNWPTAMYGGHSYRTRDPKDVADEVEWLVKTYGFKAFYFDDDTFNIGKDRILALCGEIKKRNLCIPWAVMARADTSDMETLRAMRDAGLWAIKFGVESGVQDIVNKSGKGLDLNKVREGVRNAKELGIKVHLTFTFGLPDETEDTIRQTIKFAQEVDPDSVQFSVVTPFPGTPYFKLLDSKGFIMSRKWDDYDGANRAVIRTDSLTSKQLVYWVRRAERGWYWHQLSTRLLKHPLKTLINAVKKPDYALLFLKNLFRR
jgi:anaerobic magnesium-protoporphyrin IX monomethyl ester cyclase